MSERNRWGRDGFTDREKDRQLGIQTELKADRQILETIDGGRQNRQVYSRFIDIYS